MAGLSNPDVVGRGNSVPDFSKRLYIGAGVLGEVTFKKIGAGIEGHARIVPHRRPGRRRSQVGKSGGPRVDHP